MLRHGCELGCVQALIWRWADQKVEDPDGGMQDATHDCPTDAQRISSAHVILSSMPAASYY